MASLPPQQAAQLRQVLVDCGQIALESAAQPFEVYEKGQEDYVTSVDRLLDGKLTQALQHLFPDDRLISEENLTSQVAYGQLPRAAAERLWLIDPIDGTEDFVHHGQHYALMVGLLNHYRPVAGWVYGPAVGQLYWGGPDWGLFRGVTGTPEAVEPKPPQGQARQTIILGDRDQRRFGAAIAAQIPDLHTYALGSFGLKVIEIILGHAGLYAYFNGRVKLWDTTGPLALATAAGLTCCDLDGNPLRFDPTAVDPTSLTHHQPILVGWPDLIDQQRPQLQQAIATVLGTGLSADAHTSG